MKAKKLTYEEKKYTKRLSVEMAVVEQVIGGLKKYLTMAQEFKNRL